jgi:hypothetical protein
MDNPDVKKAVRDGYAKIASNQSSCCGCGLSCCGGDADSITIKSVYGSWRSNRLNMA